MTRGRTGHDVGRGLGRLTVDQIRDRDRGRGRPGHGERVEVQPQLANVVVARANRDEALARSFAARRFEVGAVLGTRGAAVNGERATDAVTVGARTRRGASSLSTFGPSKYSRHRL